MSADVITRGFPQAIKRIEARQEELRVRKGRAGEGAARAIGHFMKAEAPYSSKADRDLARQARKVKHLRATIRVRRTPDGDYAVGPKSPLAHLVIRGARRGQREVVGGNEGAGHQTTLAGNRQARFNARGFAGPLGPGGARALSWADGTAFAHSVTVGPMPKNDFVARVRAMAAGPAREAAGSVLFHDAPLPPDPEGA